MVMTPSPAGRHADTVYNRDSAGYPYLRPGYDSNEERLLDEALIAQTTLDPDELRAVVNPSPAKLFPPRFGYPQDEIGISDVIQVDRRYPDSSAQFSGTSGGYSSTSTPSLGWW